MNQGTHGLPEDRSVGLDNVLPGIAKTDTANWINATPLLVAVHWLDISQAPFTAT